MTALAIAGILITASVPILSSLIQRYRISSTADQLYYNLQYARSEAIRSNTNVYVSFSTGDTWCYGIRSGSACNCTTANSCTLGVFSYGAAQQISLTTSGLTSNSIYFDGTRAAANASGSVTLTAYGQSSPLVRLSIGRLGGLIMCATDINGYTAC